jgi:F-type H+-transporting ATPase subunit gamma
VMAVGVRGAARLEAIGHAPASVFQQPGSVSGLSATVETILLELDSWQRRHGLDRVVVVYNAETERKASSEVRHETLLPFDAVELARLAARPWPSRTLPVFDGEPGAVLSMLLRERLFIALMRAGASSLASEHATRLIAMQAADRNIADKLDEMEGDFRRERQDAITAELMDIVSAYETTSAGRAS